MLIHVAGVYPAPPSELPLLGHAVVELPDLGLRLSGVAITVRPAAEDGVAVIAPRYRLRDGKWYATVRFDDPQTWQNVAAAVRQAWRTRADRPS